jgi:hypothetical protein
MKHCIQCDAELVEGTNWYRSSAKLSKHVCNSCLSEARRKRRHQSPAKALREGARYRATRDNLPFDITEEDIIIPAVCPVLGIPLEQNLGGKITDNSPTLDKIVPSKGYVKGNITVMSWRANSLKKDASFEEIRKLYEWTQRV